MRTCPRLWEVDAVRDGRLSERDAAASARHRLGCVVCTGAAARDRELHQLAATFLSRAPDELDLRRLRAAVLRDAASAPAGWPARTSVMGVASIAIVIAAAIVVHHFVRGMTTTMQASLAPGAAAAFAGTVVPVQGAVWSQRREESVERVRLEFGTLHIHVRHQSDIERFLVPLPDGQIEVRGTTFDVTANRESTERVRVYEGSVTLQVRGADRVVLGPGSEWPAASLVRSSKIDPPGPSSEPTTGSEDRRASPPSTAHPQTARASPDDEGIRSYSEAVEKMVGRRFTEAAAAFHDFAIAHPHAPEAEDASFLEAVALARAGRTDAAGLTAERHLQQFPASFHRKEAAILVARAARERGDCVGASRALDPWLSAADAGVMSELGACPEGVSP